MPKPQDAQPHPAALKQVVLMTVYLAVCAFGAHFLRQTNLPESLIKDGLVLFLSLGLMFPAWRYGVFSPAIGTYVGWVLLGVLAAFILG
jgi:hypothetical protein